MMELMEKPPRRVGMTIFKYILVLVLLLLGYVLASGSFYEIMRYRNLQDAAVTVTAECTHIKETYDSEDGTEYDVYLTYVYQGDSYTNFHRTFGTLSAAEKLIGTNVEIRIDPENPDDLIGEVRNGGITMSILGSLAVAFVFSAICIREREYYVKVFGWRREAIDRDLRGKMRRSASSWLWPIIFGAGMLTTGILLEATLMFIVGGAALVMGIFSLFDWAKKVRLVRQERYRITRDSLVGKHMSKDSDGDDTYHLDYSNGRETWSRNVSSLKYHQAVSGETIESVYLEGAKKPVLNYTRHEGVI